MLQSLTQQFIDNSLLCPEDRKSVEFNDTALPGFHIRVTAVSPGVGTFVQSYKDTNGKRRHMKIGRTTDLSLKDARNRAKQIRAEIQLGADPAAEIKAQKNILTWDEFFKRYEVYISNRKRSKRNDINLNKIWISPALGTRRLHRITRQDIEALHQSMLDQGRAPSTANHLIKVMRRAFNYAIEIDLITTNPAAKIKAFHEDNKRQRILSESELIDLTKVLKSDSNKTVSAVVLLLLSTGARVNEALKANWEDIDRNGLTWTIQASTSKSKRIRRVPLNDAAIRVLDSLKTEGTCPHLFINKRTGEQLTTISKVWNRLRNVAGIPDCRLHDLRHTYASYLVNGGVSIYQIKLILGHSDISITERYAHLAPETQQKAASVASDKILAALDAA